MNVCLFGTWLNVLTVAGAVAYADEILIPVIVTGKVEPAAVEQGEPIPLEVTIANGFKRSVSYSTFGLKPNDWNGETIHLTLVDIYRDGKPGGLFASRPKVERPVEIAGMGAYTIKAGKSLTVTTDARKWAIVDGWVPGKYSATVRIENLVVDQGRCVLSVHSEPFAFDIRRRLVDTAEQRDEPKSR